MTTHGPAQPAPREKSELERCLAGLETRRTLPVNHEVQKMSADVRDAARLLREMARDFEKFAGRVYCTEPETSEWRAACERWRLPK